MKECILERHEDGWGAELFFCTVHDCYFPTDTRCPVESLTSEVERLTDLINLVRNVADKCYINDRFNASLITIRRVLNGDGNG